MRDKTEEAQVVIPKTKQGRPTVVSVLNGTKQRWFETTAARWKTRQ